MQANGAKRVRRRSANGVAPRRELRYQGRHTRNQGQGSVHGVVLGSLGVAVSVLVLGFFFFSGSGEETPMLPTKRVVEFETKSPRTNRTDSQSTIRDTRSVDEVFATIERNLSLHGFVEAHNDVQFLLTRRMNSSQKERLETLRQMAKNGKSLIRELRRAVRRSPGHLVELFKGRYLKVLWANESGILVVRSDLPGSPRGALPWENISSRGLIALLAEYEIARNHPEEVRSYLARHDHVLLDGRILTRSEADSSRQKAIQMEDKLDSHHSHHSHERGECNDSFRIESSLDREKLRPLHIVQTQPDQPEKEKITPQERARIEALETKATKVFLAENRDKVRIWQFEAALDEIEAYHSRLRTESVREVVGRRIEEVRRFAGIHRALVDEIHTGKLSTAQIVTKRGKRQELVDATLERYTVRVPHGEAKGFWRLLPLDQKVALFHQISGLDVETRMAIALLCHDSDRDDLADQTLARLLDAMPDERSRVDDQLARWRNREVPLGGFRMWRGRFVTAEERSHYKRDKVRYDGRWVTRFERDQLEKGHQKIDGRWVPLTADQLLDRGYLRLESKWYTPAQAQISLGDWAKAATIETEHYLLSSNGSPAFLHRLAVAMEDAYQAYANFFGEEPQLAGKKMRIFAFANFEDYRAYCNRLGQPALIAAAGFSPCEPFTACGYDKLGDEKSFLQTLVHEGAHLFDQLGRSRGAATHLPSWLSEGVACCFEGFEVDAKGHLDFHFRSDHRMLTIQYQHGPLFGVEELIKMRAGHLLQNDAEAANLFYAQSWSLVYYILHHGGPESKEAFKDFLKRIRHGERFEPNGMGEVDMERLAPQYRRFLDEL